MADIILDIANAVSDYPNANINSWNHILEDHSDAIGSVEGTFDAEVK